MKKPQNRLFWYRYAYLRKLHAASSTPKTTRTETSKRSKRSMSGPKKQRSTCIAASQRREKTISSDASAAALGSLRPTLSQTTNDLTAFDLHSIYCRTLPSLTGTVNFNINSIRCPSSTGFSTCSIASIALPPNTPPSAFSKKLSSLG